MYALDLSNIGDLLDDNDFSVPLIVGLSTGLALVFVILILLAVYLTFTNNPIFLGSNFNVPGEFDDEESRLYEENNELPKLSDQERETYLLAKSFQSDNPPVIKPLGATVSEIEQEYINERGIQAYSFETPLEWYSSRNVDIEIEDKLDLTFDSNAPLSSILNYPLPLTTADTTYFEVKLFYKPAESLVSIGLSSKPYPLFTLPGHYKYSLAYDSTGSIRINEPFSTPAIFNKLQQGDVLGVGFKQRSGTIFFTHNGKKVHDAIHNLKFDLYPHVGAIGPCQVSVNLGQLGFVYIEANVKKWGFGATFGAIGIPPAYGKEVGEILDKGEELPPTYPIEEETFFGPSALLTSSLRQEAPSSSSNNDNNIQRKESDKRSKPPSYKQELKEVLQNDDSAEENLNDGLYERRSSVFDLRNNAYDIETNTNSSKSLLLLNSKLSDDPSNSEVPAKKYNASQSKARVDIQQSHDEPQTHLLDTTNFAVDSPQPSNSTEQANHNDKRLSEDVSKDVEGPVSEGTIIGSSPSPPPETPQHSSSSNKPRNKKKKKSNKKRGKK